LPKEPENDDQNRILLSVKMPNGKRVSRAFRKSDRVQAIYDFVDLLEVDELEIDKYLLVTSFPRKELSDKNMTVEDSGIQSLCVLFVQK